MHRLTVTTTRSFIYDQERVQRIYDRLSIDPDLYGDDPAFAVWSYLNDSLYGSDVFEDQGDFDQGYEIAEHDPDA